MIILLATHSEHNRETLYPVASQAFPREAEVSAIWLRSNTVTFTDVRQPTSDEHPFPQRKSRRRVNVRSSRAMLCRDVEERPVCWNEILIVKDDV
jgi:hypothetical protein